MKLNHGVTEYLEKNKPKVYSKILSHKHIFTVQMLDGGKTQAAAVMNS